MEIDLRNKLKGIPHIYYLNLDHKTDRKEYMESQFDKWGITDFTRVSCSKFLAKEFDNWKHMLHKHEAFEKAPHTHRSLAVSLSTLETLRNWLETTDDPYLILMEDDTDLDLITYWHFDWNYLMNNIPYDWDCIQLGYTSNHSISFFLHKKPHHSYNGPTLFNRYYVEKLVRLHYIANKYLLIRDYGRIRRFRQSRLFYPIDVDDYLQSNGCAYALPILTQNPYLDENPKDHHLLSKIACYYWWRERSGWFTLEDFFTYGKPYDHEMTLKITR
jgi:hypothetical protein